MLSLFAISGLVLASLLWWVVMPWRAVLNERKLHCLSGLDFERPSKWPKVSVLVPAKNEADTLFGAVQSLLGVDYPDLEIILINDRSTDGTGAVTERLVQLDPRVTSIHIDHLPDGWLGKVHALQQGIRASHGDWLLFTDADVHFSPDILQRALAHCIQHDKGFLALFPDIITVRGLVGAAQAAFGIILLSMLNIARVADPRSNAAMGVGAFNLVKRKYLDPQAGLEWLRMEVADDIGLGLMMKQRGANPAILSGRGLIAVDWYPNLTVMLDGVLQRCMMGSNYRLWLFALNCLCVGLCLCAPLLLGLTLAPYTALAWCCIGTYFMPAIILRSGSGNIGISRASLWGISIGYVIVLYGMLRSLLSCLRHGGIYWRGTIYPLHELRAHQRVKLSSFF
jgi:hypothetical protein